MSNVTCLNPAHKERSHLPGTAAAAECAALGRRGGARLGTPMAASATPPAGAGGVEQEQSKAALSTSLGRIWKSQGASASITDAADALAEDGWHPSGMSGWDIRGASAAIAAALRESLPEESSEAQRESWPDDEEFANSVVSSGISRDRSVSWQQERVARLVQDATSTDSDFRDRFDRHAGPGAARRITSAEVLENPAENYHASVRVHYAGRDLMLSIRSDPNATSSLVTVTPADRPHARLAEGISEPLASVLGRSAERLDTMDRQERIDRLSRNGGQRRSGQRLR